MNVFNHLKNMIKIFKMCRTPPGYLTYSVCVFKDPNIELNIGAIYILHYNFWWTMLLVNFFQNFSWTIAFLLFFYLSQHIILSKIDKNWEKMKTKIMSNHVLDIMLSWDIFLLLCLTIIHWGKKADPFSTFIVFSCYLMPPVKCLSERAL